MHRLSAPPLPPWLERMVPSRRYRVSVGGGYRMHVMEQGEGFPVVLLHGNPTWGVLYRKVARALEHDGLRLIMPDLIGLGLSDKPTQAAEHQLEAHIGWMAALFVELELARCVVAVQDWGGPIGIGALERLPEIAAGLVVMNTVVGPPKEGFRPTLFHRFARLPGVSELAFRGLGFPQNALWLAQGDRGSVRGDAARAYRYPLRDRASNVAPLALARMVPDSSRHPSIEPLARCERYVRAFDGPAAIVWGDRDPVLGRVRGRMEKLFPQATVVRTDAGHFLQEEVPGPIAEAIRRVAGDMG